MALKSGEIWVFRHDGSGELSLELPVYLENGRLTSSKQYGFIRARNGLCDARALVLSAQDTPDVIRDLTPSELAQDE